MSIDKKLVVVGSCYTTANNQHRRVIEVTDDAHVVYESWGGNVGHQGRALLRNTAKLEKFAEAVDNLITCPVTLPPLP